MAFVAGQRQDPNDPGYQGAGYQFQDPNAPPAFTSAGLAAGGTATPGGAGTGPNGKFVNFQNFMNANQGGAQKMDQSLANDINNQGYQAQSAIQQASNQFANDVQNAPTNSTTTTVPGQTYTANAPSPNLPGFSLPWSTQQHTQTVQLPGTSYTTQSYAGPTSMSSDPNSGYAAAQQQAQDASAAANATGSQSGLGSLLQAKYGGSSGYTGGDNAYDAALAGAYGGKSFSDLRNKWGGLANVIEQADQNSQQYVGNRENQLAAQNAAAQQAAGQPPGLDYYKKKQKQPAPEGGYYSDGQPNPWKRNQ